MSKRVRVYSLAISLSLGCTSVRGVSGPPPKPLPPAPSETPLVLVPDSGDRGPWTFAYAPGKVAYRITRNATIQQLDTISGQNTSRNTTSSSSTHEVLTFEPGPQGIRITAVLDSLAPVADAPEQVGLHPQISATLAASILTIEPSDTVTCAPVRSALITDVQNLVVAFPDSLRPGMAWKDSVNVQGCQAGIPTSNEVTRTFLVRGEVPSEGRLTLEVVRSDTAHINGEGGLQRHRVSIHAVGTGTGTYYLDVVTGQLLRLNVSQVMNVDVITLATRSQFEQRLQQQFLLSP